MTEDKEKKLMQGQRESDSASKIQSLANLSNAESQKPRKEVDKLRPEAILKKTKNQVKFGLNTMQMFRLDLFGNKIETSYAFKPFTPLVYSATSDYVMEILIYTTVKKGDE